MIAIDRFAQMCADAAKQIEQLWDHHINFLFCDWPALYKRFDQSLDGKKLTSEQKKQAFFDHVMESHKDD